MKRDLIGKIFAIVGVVVAGFGVYVESNFFNPPAVACTFQCPPGTILYVYPITLGPLFFVGVALLLSGIVVVFLARRAETAWIAKP